MLNERSIAKRLSRLVRSVQHPHVIRLNMQTRFRVFQLGQTFCF